MKIYTPSHIANYFLKRAESQGIDITLLKLLKLVYIGYGWVLALTDRKLFDEDIQAWQHGPVIPSLYYEFKPFGRMPIDKFATDLNLETLYSYIPEIDKDDKDVLLILARVWDIYHKFTASTLRNKTHEADTPWTETYKGGIGANETISTDLIKAHFKKKIEGYLDAAER
jgi:uncharacterized phage-associated protein